MDGSPSSLRAVLVLTVMISLFLLLSVTPSEGQTTSITSSGLGTTISPASIDPAGRPNYVITGGTRPGDGPNLFHSFGNFSIGTNNVARFFNESGRATTNILSRVTGGQPSNIFGTIQTAGFGSAALWLINPAGIVFGPTASLNVGGSVHFSTADYLRLGSGNDRFYADLGKTSQLTSAAVTAFGFLGGSVPKPITLQSDAAANGFFVSDPAAPLPVAPIPHALSLVGGDISITARTISTNGGAVDLISAASAGEVSLNQSNGTGMPPTFTGFTEFGKTTLSNGASIDTSTTQRVTPTQRLNPQIAAGAIYIRGGQLELDASSLKAISRSYDGSDPIVNVQGGDIIVTAERVTLTNQSTIQTGSAHPQGVEGNRGVIGRDSTGHHIELTPGTIEFNVGNLLVRNSTIDVSSSVGDGKPGSLVINGLAGPGTGANSVTLQNSAVRLDAGPQTGFVQDGGDVEIHSKDVLLDRLAYSSGAGDGKGGDIRVQSTNKIDIQNSDLGSASFFFLGNGGAIALEAGKEINLLATTLQSKTAVGLGSGDVTLSAPAINVHGGKILTETTSLQAGNITFNVGTLKVDALQTEGSTQPAIVSSSAVQSVETTPAGTFFGNPTQAGIITVQGLAGGGTAATSVVLDNSILATTSNSKNTSTMRPATISIAAQNIDLTNRAQVRADTSGEVLGGNIILNAGGAITLTNGAAISSRSTGISGTVTIPEKAGLAGDITLTSGHNILMANSVVTTSAAAASGGNITLTAPNVVQLVGATLSSDVKGQVQFVNGELVIPKGGDITIDTANPQAVVIQGNSLIHANAPEGQGGNINIIAGVVLQEPGSVLDASSRIGLSGTINIQAPFQQLSGAIAPLPQAFAVATNLYGQRCATQKGGQFSSFLEGARDGVPPQPGDLIPSPLLLEPEGTTPSLASQSSPNLAAVRLGLPDFDHPATVTFMSFSGCRS